MSASVSTGVSTGVSASVDVSTSSLYFDHKLALRATLGQRLLPEKPRPFIYAEPGLWIAT